MSPSASFTLRVGKCEKNEAKIKFFTDELTHMLATRMGHVGIFKVISNYKLWKDVTRPRGHLGHFG